MRSVAGPKVPVGVSLKPRSLRACCIAVTAGPVSPLARTVGTPVVVGPATAVSIGIDVVGTTSATVSGGTVPTRVSGTVSSVAGVNDPG